MRSGRGCGLVMRPSRRLVRWVCRTGRRCGPIWCGVAGSGPCRGGGSRPVELAEREEISRGLAAGRRCGRSRPAWAGRRRRSVVRSPPTAAGAGTGPPGRPAGVVASRRRPKACKLADQPGAACHRGREAEAAVVTAADRRLAEGHLPRRPGDAGVARDDLPHPVHPVPRRAAQGADRASAHRAGDPTPSGHPAARWAWWPARDPQHLRTTRRSRRPGGARALGRRPGLRQTDEPGRHPGRTVHPVRDAGRAARRTTRPTWSPTPWPRRSPPCPRR